MGILMNGAHLELQCFRALSEERFLAERLERMLSAGKHHSMSDKQDWDERLTFSLFSFTY
jgi:hypothetical protein